MPLFDVVETIPVMVKFRDIAADTPREAALKVRGDNALYEVAARAVDRSYADGPLGHVMLDTGHPTQTFMVIPVEDDELDYHFRTAPCSDDLVEIQGEAQPCDLERTLLDLAAAEFPLPIGSAPKLDALCADQPAFLAAHSCVAGLTADEGALALQRFDKLIATLSRLRAAIADHAQGQ